MLHLILIVVCLITFISVPSAFTQSRKITETELKKLISGAAEKRKGLPLREKYRTTGYAPGDSSETLYEFGPNDTYRYQSVKRVKGVETKTEGIRIGNVRYTRQQDGSWIKELPQGRTGSQGSGSGSGSASASTGTPPETATEYLYIGNETIRGQVTSRYRKARTIKFTSLTPAITRRVVEEYWFRTDGMLVKESHEDTFVGSNRSYKSIREYEYDKDIRITAPIPD